MQIKVNDVKILVPHFVDLIPTQISEGSIYISIKYQTVVHSCACGCGQEVVTPLSPAQWKLIYDGEKVSLSPSIGNWSFPCKSHYYIEQNKVVWSTAYSNEQIKDVRALDQNDIELHYDNTETKVINQSKAKKLTETNSWFKRIWQKIFS